MEAINKVVAKAAGVSTSSAAGKTHAGNPLRGVNEFHIYNIGTVVLAELTIRYTQRARLVRCCRACAAQRGALTTRKRTDDRRRWGCLSPQAAALPRRCRGRARRMPSAQAVPGHPQQRRSNAATARQTRPST